MPDTSPSGERSPTRLHPLASVCQCHARAAAARRIATAAVAIAGPEVCSREPSLLPVGKRGFHSSRRDTLWAVRGEGNFTPFNISRRGPRGEAIRMVATVRNSVLFFFTFMLETRTASANARSFTAFQPVSAL